MYERVCPSISSPILRSPLVVSAVPPSLGFLRVRGVAQPSTTSKACWKLSSAPARKSKRRQTPVNLKEMEEDPADEILAGMKKIGSNKKWAGHPDGTSRLPRSVETAVRKLMKSGQPNSGSAARLLKFARTKANGEEKLLKITSAPVPKGILPEGWEGELHDIKTGGRQADDKIYSSHPDIREMIPRGTTVLELKCISSSSSSNKDIQDIVIYANRKFTGDIGDEDDGQPENNGQWQQYFLKDMEETQQVVCQQKINGEAAHFSGRFYGNDFYIITGSKNVHMIIKDKEDIDKYEGERYTFAKVVAKCVWQTLQALEDSHREFLQRFLDKTKCTAICELLQKENQHIMNLEYLKKPKLNVITFTPTYSDVDFGSLVAIPPHHTLDFLSSLGFEVPVYTVIPLEKMQRHREEIRRGEHGYHEEGEVLYFLGGDEETIGLVKTKTMWYIMLRALREKVLYTRHRQSSTIKDRIDSTHRRFNEIQEWLQFSDSYLEAWKKLASSFMEWIDGEVEEGSITLENVRPKYPVVWEMFLKETEQTDVLHDV